MRQYLTANAAYSVPADFPDPQTAYDWIRDNLDLGGKNVLVAVAPGDYPGFTMAGRLTGAAYDGALSIVGDEGNPTLVRINGADKNGIVWRAGATARVAGFKVSAANPVSFATGGHGLQVFESARAETGVMAYGDCPFACIDVASDGQLATSHNAQYLMGQSQRFGLVEDGGKLWLNGSYITSLVPIHFADALLHTSRQGFVDCSGTIINNMNSMTGKLYNAKSGSQIILLGMLPQQLSPGEDDGTAIIVL